MKTLIKQYIVIIAVLVIASAASTRAATLTNVSDTLSNPAPSKTGVTHTIKFDPISNIAANGDLKITLASGFDLTSVAASADVSVTGGGVTWDTVQNSDLNAATRVLILGWSSGALTIGNTVTVTMNFAKNPTSAGSYDVTIEVGPDGFSTATDSRTIPVRIIDSGVAVTGSVPFPETNPTITNIVPTETIVISANASQIISFDITDVNNDNVDYTVTPGTGTISVAPSPASPVSNTLSTVTVSFTYFADGLTGSQIITVTADDNEATGGGIVTYNIDIFII
jgi:hypothetical protein